MQTKLIPAAIAAALLLASGYGQASDSTAATAQPATAQDNNAAEGGGSKPPTIDQLRNQTLVTVNGQTVTGEIFGIYLNDRVQQSPGVKNTPELQNQAINELINIFLLAEAATTAGLDQRQDVVTTLDLQRKQLLSRLALREYAAKHQPSDEDLKKAYDESVAKQEGEEYKARHILVKTEDEAKKLIEELDNGADFAELAKKHSTGPTGKNGGDLGWFDAGQMVKPFSDAVKGLEVGTVSPTPVKTQFGWHVIKLEEKRAKQPPTFESVKNKLLADAQRKSLSEYVNKLRDQAKVEINQDLAKKPGADATPELPKEK
jgi:peptidyl-prolyl cis-trans isomerase C